MSSFVSQFLPHCVSILALATSIFTSAHIILHKRDTRAATGWIGLAWLAPFIGAGLYFCFGVNRIRRRAKVRRESLSRSRPSQIGLKIEPDKQVSGVLGKDHLSNLSRLIGCVTEQPLLKGNLISPLRPREAYSAMLASIGNATRSISLCTYLFENDEVGQKFVEALQHAHKRGVEIRILIDAIGARYSFPPILRALHRTGLKVGTFMPTMFPWRFPYMNLRNHRKILVVDGADGFTGGMNIRSGPTTAHPKKLFIEDLHFQIKGPVLRHLQATFAEDWFFSTGDNMQGELWFPALKEIGTTAARGISDGPDEDFEKIVWTILGAVACAQYSILIYTPYFLPDHTIITALGVAALRGVDVRVVIPEMNNLTLVKWAMMANYWQLLEHGVKIILTKPHFDHSKLMVVDNQWVLLGSANWDARSFRLNFEFNVECYDETLAGNLSSLINQKLKNSYELLLSEVDKRPMPIRLRDGVARLLSPYL